MKLRKKIYKNCILFFWKQQFLVETIFDFFTQI